MILSVWKEPSSPEYNRWEENMLKMVSYEIFFARINHGDVVLAEIDGSYFAVQLSFVKCYVCCVVGLFRHSITE